MALEIIGAGFGRTGTNSLKLALEHLGFGPCHHMFEVRDNPEQLPNWEAAARGEQVDWDEVFDGYRSQVDFPGARYWRELARHFPKAKVRRSHDRARLRHQGLQAACRCGPGRDWLLTFDLRDGWQPLCDFLGVSVPDIPFPKTNSSKQFGEEEWKQ